MSDDRYLNLLLLPFRDGMTHDTIKGFVDKALSPPEEVTDNLDEIVFVDNVVYRLLLQALTALERELPDSLSPLMTRIKQSGYVALPYRHAFVVMASSC